MLRSLSRIGWFAPLALLTAALGLAGCGDGGNPTGVNGAGDATYDDPGTLNVYMWSEYIDPDIVAQFEAMTGGRVRVDVYEQSETMMARMQTQGGDRQYDLLVASDYTVLELAELGLIQELDLSRVPNAGNIAERFRNPPYDPEGRWSLPYQWGTTGIVYREDRFEDFEPTWAVIFDPEYRASVGNPTFVLIDDMRDCFSAALKFLGYSVNTTDPDQIREATALILQAKNSPQCLGFEGGGKGGVTQVATGQAALAIVYSGDALAAMEEVEGLEYAVPREGSTVWVDAVVIPGRAQDLDLAYRFIDYILDPQIGGQLSTYTRFASPNQASLQGRYVAPEDQADPSIYPPDEVMQKLEMIDSVGEATVLYDEAWTAIKSR
jgi:spermidine/putrescine transport system substrate-binding protein